MSSPAKKRKRNGDPSQTTRGIESFFKGQAPKPVPKHEPASTAQTLSDEALARKLQAEWDQEEHSQNPLSDGDQAASAASEASKAPSAPSIPADTTPEVPVIPKKNTLSLQSSTGSEDTVALAVPFDQSPQTFNATEYATELRSRWASEGGDASYALLTRAFVLANSTTSRIKIVDTLVNFIRVLIEGDPSSLLPAVWLATNSISPPYDELELGLGGSSISKALKKFTALIVKASRLSTTDMEMQAMSHLKRRAAEFHSDQA
jgi:DNA ligase N terminus.